MHKFERFIVYPLLILALFYSMAGEQVNTTAQKVGDIVAESITIVNEEGKRMIELGVNEKEVSYPVEDDEVFTGKIDFGEIKTYDERGENVTAISAVTVRTGVCLLQDLAGSVKTFYDKEEAVVLGEGIKTYNYDGNLMTWIDDWSYLSDGLINLYNNDGESLIKIGDGMGLNLYNDEGNSLISLRGRRTGGGIIDVYNKHEEKVIGLGQTVPNEKGQSGNHGLINIYDKYGEDFRSYRHSYR